MDNIEQTIQRKALFATVTNQCFERMLRIVNLWTLDEIIGIKNVDSSFGKLTGRAHN